VIIIYVQGVPKNRWISVQQAVEGIRSDLWIKVGGVFQDISSLMSTKTNHFFGKMAEKNEVKHGYPPPKNGIISVYTV